LTSSERSVIIGAGGLKDERHYIETRYPADPPPVYSREEAQMAIGTAERIRQFVRTKLGVENNGP